jgi:chemotaxis protein CheD
VIAASAVRAPGASSSIAVGLGELAVARADTPDGPQLVAYGLGSCVAICLFEARSGVAGMAHVVLPGESPHGEPNARFARNALAALREAMVKIGGPADLRRYQARIAGGAQVLVISGGGSLPRVGDRNVESVRDELVRAAIPLLGEHVGGGKGRTVWFNPRDLGRIRVRTVGGPELVF